MAPPLPPSPRLLLLPLCLLALPARAADAPPAPPVPMSATIPLPEYQRLRDLDERPSATVVDVLRLGGTFKGRDLSISFEGRAAGRMPPRPVVSAPAGLRIFGCQGDALLTRGDGGVFDLTPLAPRFRLACRLAVSGSDRLQLEATPHVLFVESQIRDGEYVGSDDPSGKRSVSVVRQSAGPAEVVRPAATARYLLSLLPEETRFRYQLEVRNPNRSTQPFDVELRSGEHVQQVDAQAAYEVEGPRYRFQLPPGELTLVLSGTLTGPKLTPPIDASVQYALLESHPLLRPQAAAGDGAPRRISAAETGLPAQFRGAQGFLLAGAQPLSWTVTRLEALRSTSFAVRSMRHIFFLAADGKALGESQLNLDNQGAPDLSLPMRAEPTFASLGGEPTFLTRSESGHLWLPLSQGPQAVLVQHRQTMETRMGFALAELWLPQLKAPATSAQIELRTPREWAPLYAELAPESRLLGFSVSDLLCLVALLLWTERLLSALGSSRGRRVLLATLAAAGALLSLPLLVLLVAADAVVTVAWALPHLRRVRWSFGRVFLVGCALSMGLLVVGAVFSFDRAASPSYAPPIESSVARRESKLELREEGAMGGARGQAAPGEGGQSYQGLPAKFELPAGARQTVFDREMLTTEAPRAARALLVSRRLLAALGAACALLSVLLLFTQRQRLQAGWQRMLARPV